MACYRTGTPLLNFWIFMVALLTANSFFYLIGFMKNKDDDITVRISLGFLTVELNQSSASSRRSSSPVDANTHPVSTSTNDESTKLNNSEKQRMTLLRSDPTNKEVLPKEETKKKLNVLLFYADDWRHDTLGAAGTQPVHTPFLDQLSSDGIRFTQNAVTTSICWISRATLLTGQYFSRHKSRFLRKPVFYDRWNETFPYKLQQNGYYVGHIGKWQFRNPNFVQNNYNWTSLYEGSHWYNVDKQKMHSTARDERESIRFLRERPKDVPFVLTTAFYAPKAVGVAAEQHFPMEKTERLYENVTIPLPVDPEQAFLKLPQFMQDNWYYLEARRRYKQRFDFNVTGMYERFQKKYYRMITEVDEAMKNVVDELQRQGILHETVIIFTTDNGLFHAEHGLAGKWFPFQESIRVPLIIRDPRMTPDTIGTLEDAFTLNIDLTTTILGAAGLAPTAQMQGRDIADLYLKPNAKATWRKEFFYEHPGMGKGIPESSALVRKDFKYMKWPEFNYEQLFDLKKDPLEHNDIAKQSEYASLLAEMRAEHDVLKRSVL
jgi:arylsulfatase